jgi:hypothetical protein
MEIVAKTYHHLFSTSSTIYETFMPFNVLLNFCGFLYNGMNTTRQQQQQRRQNSCATIEIIRITLSVIYTIIFILLFILNVMLGEQEPRSTTSFILRHSGHKVYLLKIFFIPSLFGIIFIIERCCKSAFAWLRNSINFAKIKMWLLFPSFLSIRQHNAHRHYEN